MQIIFPTAPGDSFFGVHYMKRFLSSAVLISLLFCGCCTLTDAPEPISTQPQPPVESQIPDTLPPAPSLPVATEPVPTEPVATEPVVTEPDHSPLYIPGVSPEDVMDYFGEVCLDAEYIIDGDPTRLQKWVSPICYILYGEPTEEDLATLTAFAQWLNSISGFPGMQEATIPAEANLKIYFCTKDEMLNILGSGFAGNDAGVTFWYNGANEIYDATICYRTDLDQTLRNSVILEEIYNCLGPIQDTDLRTDSIIYAGFSQPQSLTAVDELLLQLLDHPQMKCGMNASQCEAVIRQLYN